MEGSHTPVNGTVHWRVTKLETAVTNLETQVYGEEGLPVIRRAVKVLAEGQTRTNRLLTAVAVTFLTASVTFVALLVQGALGT